MENKINQQENINMFTVRTVCEHCEHGLNATSNDRNRFDTSNRDKINYSETSPPTTFTHRTADIFFFFFLRRDKLYKSKSLNSGKNISDHACPVFREVPLYFQIKCVYYNIYDIKIHYCYYRYIQRPERMRTAI